MLRHLLPATLFLLATASAAHADDTPTAGQAAFGACRGCHSVEKGKNGFGPSLYGVVGRRAGAVPGFSYSKAMTGSGVTWDAAALDAYIAAPQARIPGNRMPYGGLKDAAKRQAIIDYLKTLHD
ncbi:c-type cytochrome [Asticcacaulis solisilvae]|uniref:c-type cytochrome n=1 Tax=Asticcacaulis solisilvae TaxID=1217274 RepID=UPI003FD6E497